MGDNQTLLNLLYKEPSVFLEGQQSTIGSIVGKFVCSGAINEGERDDVIQYINERLLSKILKKMQQQYNHSVLVNTYFSKIVYNLCIEYTKKLSARREYERNMDFSTFNVLIDETVTSDIALKEVYEHLSTIFLMYDKHRYRIEFLIKIYMKIGVTREDILLCYPNCPDESLFHILDYFGDNINYQADSDIKLFGVLAPLINTLENKNNLPDTLRRWIDGKLDEISALMRIPPINACLTRETLKILLEKYYKEYPNLQ